jgi:hypothetical protein
MLLDASIKDDPTKVTTQLTQEQLFLVFIIFILPSFVSFTANEIRQFDFHSNGCDPAGSFQFQIFAVKIKLTLTQI